MPGPRWVEVRDNALSKDRPCAGLSGPGILGWSSNCPIPITLSICQESRYETLHHYSLSFATRECPARIYFDKTIDTLFFSGAIFVPFMYSQELFDTLDIDDVQSLALTNPTFEYASQHVLAFAQPGPEWLQVKEFILVIDFKERLTGYFVDCENTEYKKERTDNGKSGYYPDRYALKLNHWMVPVSNVTMKAFELKGGTMHEIVFDRAASLAAIRRRHRTKSLKRGVARFFCM